MKENSPQTLSRTPWLWVLGGFLFQTIPASLRDEALPIALKNNGVNDSTITQTVGILGLLVALKIFWAPFMNLLGSPRRLILICQCGVILCIIGLSYFVNLNQPYAIALCLGVMTLLSGGHDFLLDGYFVQTLDESQRAPHSGLLNFSSKLGQVLAGPGLIFAAYIAQTKFHLETQNISVALIGLAIVSFIILLMTRKGFSREPKNENLSPVPATVVMREMIEALKSLYHDSRLLALVGLIFFYRASEIHMNHVVKLFSKAAIAQGGLGLSDENYAMIRLCTAIAGLAIGGIIGSIVITRRGLSRSLVPLGICMHIPLIGITWLAFHSQPTPSLLVIGAIYLIEYIAFGAGVCALILAMMKVAAGPQSSVRYALLSALALISVYLPGLWAGALSNHLGYGGYFVFAGILAIPGIAVSVIAAKKL